MSEGGRERRVHLKYSKIRLRSEIFAVTVGTHVHAHIHTCIYIRGHSLHRNICKLFIVEIVKYVVNM